MRVEMKERRETLLASLKVGLTAVGQGAASFLNDPKQMGAAVGLATGLAAGVYGARGVAGVAASYVEARLGKPTLIRETSRLSPLAAPFSSLKRTLISSSNTAASESIRTGEKAIEGVVLAPELEERLKAIAVATANTKANGAPFRHLMLHGPPGTGKTLFAKKLASYSGLDYAIMTGGDVAPLGRDAVTQIHKLFDWAKASRRGLLLFVDEADAFLRKRASSAMSEDLRNAFNAFLYRTGDQTHNFMLVFATNQPSDFDPALNDRVDDIVQFDLPDASQREKLLRLYLDVYLGPDQEDAQSSVKILIDGITDEHIQSAVEATEHFSGREITKLVIAWQAAAFGTQGALFTPTTMRQVLDHHVAQRKLKSKWALVSSGN